MVSKTEDWWEGNFQKYSIKNYRTMSIYLKFKKCTEPFSKGDHNFREGYWRDDNCYIYEWYERTEQKGEKFGLDCNSTTYFYENWFLEDSIHVVVKSWLRDQVEWGVLIKYYPDHEESQSWTVDGISNSLESKKVFPDKIESVKSGKKLTPSGIEDFTEKFWETRNETGKERTWKRGSAEGIEKSYKEGEKAWGETWEEDGINYKKSNWTEEGGKVWGEAEGKNGLEEWQKTWEKDPENDFEENKHKNGVKKWGSVRSLSNEGRYQLEWEGQQPQIVLEEDESKGISVGIGKPKDQKLRSTKKPENRESSPREGRRRSEDQEKALVLLAETTKAQLQSVFDGNKDELLNRILELEGVSPPALQLKLVQIKENIENYPDANSTESILQGINDLRNFGSELNNLESTLISTFPDPSQISQAFLDLASTASSLHSLIDSTNQSDFKLDLGQIQREFELQQSPKDKFNSLTHISPLLRTLINFQSRNAAEFDRKNAEITELLSKTLKGFEEVLNESQNTLVKVRNVLHDQHEESEMIESAYLERSKKLINDIETLVPYTKTLPELSDLLRDMEKFKRELLETKIPQTIQDLINKQSELKQELLQGLKQEPLSEESPASHSGIMPALQSLSSKIAENEVLAQKLLGKNINTGNPALDSIKPVDLNEKINTDVKDLLKFFWVNGQSEQISAGNTLKRLVSVFGSESEKTQIEEYLQKAKDALEGHVPETNQQALEQLRESIEGFLPVKLSQSDLLEELVQKCEEKARAAEVKPEAVKDSWRSLILADKIAEKLVSGDVPPSLEEVRKTVEAFPAKAEIAALQQATLKLQEIALGLINADDNLTAEELKDLDKAANRQAGGKTGVMKKQPNKALRSGRGGPKRLNVSDPSVELIEKSLKTTGDLALWVLGSRPIVNRHIESLKSSKEPIITAIQQDGGSEQAIDGVLNFLSTLENEKSAIYSKGDVIKNLVFVVQKSFKVLESASGLLNTPIPAEANELQNKPTSGDLSDLVKRAGFFLSIFFKMVKEATGIDDGNEHLDDAMKSLMQKQAVSSLPFDPIDLLSELKSKNTQDLRRLKFLAGLVGSNEQVQFCENLEKRADETLHELNPKDNHEAMAQIDQYLHSFPAIEKEISSETEKMLSELLERLTNPEPLERDVAGLISSAENLDLALKKTGFDTENLSLRKSEIPTHPTTLLSYLVDLVKDYSQKTLETVGKPSNEDLKNIDSIVSKKVRCAPVLILRDIQHLFAGPGIPDTIELVLKLSQIVESKLKHGTVEDPALYSKCLDGIGKLDKLTPYELKELAKNYTDVLVGVSNLLQNSEEIFSQVEEKTMEIMARRRQTVTVSMIPWADIFKSRGLDLDANVLLESILQEQEFAKIYIQAFTNTLGSSDQKLQAKSIVQRSEEILKIEDEALKIQNYIHLRQEQSRLVQYLSSKQQNLSERLSKLDSERSSSIKQTITEVEILIEKNNPGLKSQLQVIIEKEQANLSANLENMPETVLRLTGRLGLERELQRIKDEAKPADNSEAEMLKKLVEIESKLFAGLKNLLNSLVEVAGEVKPTDFSEFKGRTEFGVSNTIPAVLASLIAGIDSVKEFSSAFESLLVDNPSKLSVLNSLDLLKQQSVLDDTETETVFSGLFRLVGSPEDKSKAKKLRESRSLVSKDHSKLIDLSSLLSSHLSQFLTVRTSQSQLQSKLTKEAGNLREGIDDVDLSTEDIMNKALREVANSIMPDDSRSKSGLDSIRKSVEGVNEISATNIPETIERVTKRLENWEKLERLRRDLREKLSKEINRLKGDVQDKANELETARATIEGVKTQYEAQLIMLQNTAEQHSALIEKLTQEAIDKEKDLSGWKNKTADLGNVIEGLKEDLEKLQDEVDSNNKELRNLRRVSKEKDAKIRDLEENLEGLERTTEKSSLGDKEKSEISNKLKEEIKIARDELSSKSKVLDETEEKLTRTEREKQKVEIELAAKEKDLESVRKEKSILKADVLKLETEKSELQEKSKLHEGVSLDDLRHLEKILEDKQKELEESEANLVVAKRYQLLYLEISEEKNENEENRRQLEIQNTDLKRKLEETKQENDQLKYKTRAADQTQKDLSLLQKENQKLQVRLDFLEKSGENPTEASELLRKLSDDIINKEKRIEDLIEEVRKLKEEIQGFIEKHNVSLSRSFLIRLCHAFKEQEGAAYRKWKVYKKSAPKTFDIPQQQGAIKVANEEEPEFEDDYKVADRVILEVNTTLVQSNPVLALYKSLDDKGDKTISNVSFFKFMEELMDKKFDSDKKDISEFKQIKSLPEFLPEYLTKTLGIQSLALKFLVQLIPTLHNLCTENHPYGIFFARLLNLFHPDPISYSLAIYLVKIRMEFQPLLEKYERSMVEPVKKGEKNKKPANSGKNAYELAGSGGMALLTDVIELVYQLFVGDKEAGLKVLELLKPSKISHEDFVAFKICHKMAKLGKTPEMIFKLLDKDQGGTIDSTEFITGTKDDLDLWISDANISKLMSQLDTDGTGEVTKEAFMGKISMKALMQWNKDPNFAVSKASFLNALADVHKFKHRKLTAKLNPEFKKVGKDNMSVNEFAEVVARLEPGLSKQEIDKLFFEASAPDRKAVTFNHFAIVASKYGMGEVKSFKVRELAQQLARRKSFVGAMMIGSEVTVEEETVIKKKIAKAFLSK